MIQSTQITTVLGNFTLWIRNESIIRLFFENDNPESFLREGRYCELFNNREEYQMLPSCPLADDAAKQLNEYGLAARRKFELPLEIWGVNLLTEKTAKALLEIPFGRTISYSGLAHSINCNGVRAVGTAVGKNPLPILIPCHRVIASDGRIGGYRGGLEMKKKLLAIEGINIK